MEMLRPFCPWIEEIVLHPRTHSPGLCSRERCRVEERGAGAWGRVLTGLRRRCCGGLLCSEAGGPGGAAPDPGAVGGRAHVHGAAPGPGPGGAARPAGGHLRPGRRHVRRHRGVRARLPRGSARHRRRLAPGRPGLQPAAAAARGAGESGVKDSAPGTGRRVFSSHAVSRQSHRATAQKKQNPDSGATQPRNQG